MGDDPGHQNGERTSGAKEFVIYILAFCDLCRMLYKRFLEDWIYYNVAYVVVDSPVSILSRDQQLRMSHDMSEFEVQ